MHLNRKPIIRNRNPFISGTENPLSGTENALYCLLVLNSEPARPDKNVTFQGKHLKARKCSLLSCMFMINLSHF